MRASKDDGPPAADSSFERFVAPSHIRIWCDFRPRRFRPVDEIEPGDHQHGGDAEAKFATQGLRKDKQVIAYCGGGISATIDLFLLHRLGYDNLTLYDASMGEWAKDEALPIETD